MVAVLSLSNCSIPPHSMTGIDIVCSYDEYLGILSDTLLEHV